MYKPHFLNKIETAAPVTFFLYFKTFIWASEKDKQNLQQDRCFYEI